MGRKIDASDLRAISGFETADRLKENSGLFAFTFPTIKPAFTTSRMFPPLPFIEIRFFKDSFPKARLLKLWNNGYTKAMFAVGLD